MTCAQDVIDVLTAIDYVIEKGLADPSKITVLGGSHGGFLTTHLIGQVELSLEVRKCVYFDQQLLVSWKQLWF